MIASATVSSTANGHLDAADVGSRDGLLAALALVDAEGWDGLTGRSVLGYARVHVVRPVDRAVGFTGADLNFAEATGWGIAWETLSGRLARTSESPWEVVRSAVRRAVVEERLGNLYATGTWSAWRIHRQRRDPRWSDRPRADGDWAGVADPSVLKNFVLLSDNGVVHWDNAGCGEACSEADGVETRHGEVVAGSAAT
jgi:hypothetical protein